MCRSPSKNVDLSMFISLALLPSIYHFYKNIKWLFDISVQHNNFLYLKQEYKLTVKDSFCLSVISLVAVCEI